MSDTTFSRVISVTQLAVGAGLLLGLIQSCQSLKSQSESLVAQAESLRLQSEAISVQVQQTRAEHDRRKREAAMNLVARWRDVMDRGDVRYHLDLVCSKSLTDEDLGGIIRHEEVPHLKGQGIKSSDVCRDIVAVLNTFDEIAMSIRSDVADRVIAEENFQEPIWRYAHSLRRFEQKWKEVKGRGSGWPLVYSMVDQWGQLANAKPSVLKTEGQVAK